MKKILYWSCIGLIFLLSFFFYSSLFYPALNSDNAVTILMIHYFKLPHDLYFWGQDRMGSLIPLIGQIFYKVFHFSALTAESITHYGILLLGFLAFASFLKSRWYKIVFAIIWFFPPMRLIDVTQFAFGIHYSLIAISCYLISLYDRRQSQNNMLLNHFILFLTMITMITAVWVNDMAIMSVVLLICVQLFFYLKANKLTKLVFKKPQLYYGIFGVLIGYLFIHYAKSQSPKQVYAAFGDLNSIMQTIKIFLKTITDFLLFKSDEPFTSVYAYMVIIIIICSIFVLRKMQVNETTKKWALYFLIDAVVVFAIIMISKWTLVSDVPRRYFTCTYIAFSFALLLLFDNIDIKTKYARFIKTFLVLTVVVGGMGTLYNLKYVWPKSLTPVVKITGEFKQLGKIGIIADYWNSYIISCTDPATIKATPHDQTYAVRNYQIVDEVFMQKNIYIIKDMWMETFPDSLNQFGRTMIKDGSEFSLGNCDVCKYRKSGF